MANVTDLVVARVDLAATLFNCLESLNVGHRYFQAYPDYRYYSVRLAVLVLRLENWRAVYNEEDFASRENDEVKEVLHRISQHIELFKVELTGAIATAGNKNARRTSFVLKFAFKLELHKQRLRECLHQIGTLVDDLEKLQQRFGPTIEVKEDIRAQRLLSETIAMDITTGNAQLTLKVEPGHDIKIVLKSESCQLASVTITPPQLRRHSARSDTTADLGRRIVEEMDSSESHERDASESYATPSNSDSQDSSGSYSSKLESETYLSGVGYVSTPRMYDTPEDQAVGGADKWFGHLRDYTHKLVNASLLNSQQRVRVAILDSGFTRNREGHNQEGANAWLHKMRYRCQFYQNFLGEDQSQADGDKKYHGTNCASVLMQVAPNADVYVARVIAADGSIDPDHVSDALDWAMKQKVDIISISFAWEKVKSNVQQRIKKAIGSNILVFAAASNDGELISANGVWPASENSVFCIHSGEGYGLPARYSTAPRPDKINFKLLGERIAIFDGEPPQQVGGFPRLSGTSYATPVAAGTAALVLEFTRKRLSKKNLKSYEGYLKSYDGMCCVFKAMNDHQPSGGFYNVLPWKLLGKKERLLTEYNATRPIADDVMDAILDKVKHLVPDEVEGVP